MSTNRTHVRPYLRVEASADATVVDLVFDPQTSGGLLIAVPTTSASSLVAALHAAGEPAAEIGVATERSRENEPYLAIR